MNKKIASVVLVLVMILSVISCPQTTCAQENISVYFTINNQGTLALSSDNSLMFNKEVIVNDLNDDGNFTVEEALISAHNTYYYKDGMANNGYNAPNGFVNRLWGVDTTNNLFFINGLGLSGGVTEDTIANGDRITASVNKDNTYYSDWYCFFDAQEKTVFTDEEFTLSLKGHLGMAFAEEDKINVPLVNIPIGIQSGSTFTQISGKTTDRYGNVTLSFDKAGTYYITANGTVNDTVTDYYLMDLGDFDAVYANVYGKVDFSTFKLSLAYTETNYGAGPYPAEEIKYIESDSWENLTDKSMYYTLENNQLTASCPLIAPAAKITVKDKPQVEIIHNIAKEYVSSDLTASGGNLPWILADLTVYEYLYPDSTFILDDTQKKNYLRTIISTANTTDSPSELAKCILTISALGYDAKNVYTADLGKGDIVTVLTAFVDNKDTKVTNIYNLPVIITALSQNESFATEEQMNFLLNAAIIQKQAWFDLSYGTDAMTPMILALYPYYNSNTSVKEIVDEAIEIIKGEQLADGMIDGPEGFGPASTALAIAGLSAYGIDSETTANGGKNLIEGLMSDSNNELNGFSNVFSTEQGFRGLLAWRLLKENKEVVMYDFSDIQKKSAYNIWAENCPVRFTVSPSDAVVSITGVTAKAKNVFDLPTGQYSYTATKSGYESQTGIVNITNADTEKEISINLAQVTTSSGDFVGGSGSSSENKDETEENEETEMLDNEEVTETRVFSADTFKDVSENDWFYSAVKYAYENCLFEGTENGFEPDTNMSRAMLVTILYRLESPEDAIYENPFNDIQEDMWYSQGVKWAKNCNIVSGATKDTFLPEQDLTREQLAVIIYNYARMKDLNIPASEKDINSYHDAEDISDYAVSAMEYLVSSGLMQGKSENTINPKDTTTRAEVATILMRFCQYIKEA